MDGRIYHLKNLLAERLKHPWTVEEMASGLNLSASHFQKLFKAHTGVPPIEFLRNLRLEMARDLLETTFLRIKEVAVQTGHVDASQFSRDFKLKYGVTPYEYRKQIWKTQSDKPTINDRIDQEKTGYDKE